MVVNELVSRAKAYNEEVERVYNELLSDIKQEAESIYNKILEENPDVKTYDISTENVKREELVRFMRYLLNIFKNDVPVFLEDEINPVILMEFYSFDFKISELFRYNAIMEKLDIDNIEIIAK